jgi:integrase/recombinase XerC
MNLPTLPTLLSAFFLRYLAVERGVSPHTTTSYRDAMKLLLQFAAARCRRSVDQLVIEDLTAPVVLEFLADLETSRGNTIRTRNSRLAAVQTFFRYVAGREPALAATCSPVLSVPAKKALRPLLGYLSEQELGHLLSQIDRLAKYGERDYVLLTILYDTGARIQELLDLTPRDFHLESPPFVCVRGKECHSYCISFRRRNETTIIHACRQACDLAFSLADVLLVVRTGIGLGPYTDTR